MKFTNQNEELLFIGLCILAGLLLISFVRILLLLRQRRKQDERAERLEQQILHQQKEIMATRSDASAWRGEMQRQFDAFRADTARRHGEAELRAADVQKRLDAATEQHDRRVFELQASLDAACSMCSELPDAKARIIELERMLDDDGLPATNGFDDEEMKSLAKATKSVAHLPVLPSMETLEDQDGTTGSELEAVRTDLAETQQRNAELARALLLARRRRQPARKPRGR